jgi:uncharacterized membrane protein
MIMIAFFAALSYLMLVVLHIPYPSPSGNPFIHLGNMVVILAALLIGGWQGGLSGSIGMGLYDMTNGYMSATPTTIILKFGIGFFTGLIARRGLKKPESNPRKGLYISSAISLVIGGIILTGKLIKWTKFENVSFIAYLFLLFLGVILGVVATLSYKYTFITREVMYAALGAVAGITWNVFGVFTSKTIKLLIGGSQLQAAMLTSLMSLPATFINGAFSIVGAIILYMPLKRALLRARLGNMLVK